MTEIKDRWIALKASESRAKKQLSRIVHNNTQDERKALYEALRDGLDSTVRGEKSDYIRSVAESLLIAESTVRKILTEGKKEFDN